jgi:hypothetical protein
MSDILEDQKIHYIVKDYRRMYEMHTQLVDAVKEATAAIKHKDNRIRDLEKQVTNLQVKLKHVMSTEKSVLVRSKAILARDQMKATEARAAKGIKLMEDLIATIESEAEIELPVVCNGEVIEVDDENTL